MKTIIALPVDFNGRKTDAESIASAMDNVIRCGLGNYVPDDWSEYGGPPHLGETICLNPKEAEEAADMLDGMIDGKPGDEMGEVLTPARNILWRLLRLLGKKDKKRKEGMSLKSAGINAAQVMTTLMEQYPGTYQSILDDIDLCEDDYNETRLTLDPHADEKAG